MGKNYQMRENVFAPPFDMENGSAENIARDAVSSIMEVCDRVGKQREAEVTFDQRPLEYSMQLMYLKTLLRNALITDEEYKRVLKRLRKDYGVVSEWSP